MKARLTHEGGASGLCFAVETGTVRWKLDSGENASDPSPAQALLAVTGACSAMDVISILRKKRQAVTGYEVELEGDRRETHPRSFTAIRIVHKFRGVNLDPRAVEEAIRLSEEKYCTVIASLRPTVAVSSRFEIAAEGDAA